MGLLLELLAEAAAILLLAMVIPDIKIKNFGTAFAVAIVIALLNVTIGFLLRLPLNLVSFFLLGFLVRLVVTVIMIKIADKLFRGFEVNGWLPAIILAIGMALAGTLVDYIW